MLRPLGGAGPPIHPAAVSVCVRAKPGPARSGNDRGAPDGETDGTEPSPQVPPLERSTVP